MIDVVAIIAFVATTLSLLATFWMWNVVRTTPGLIFTMNPIHFGIALIIWGASGYYLFGMTVL